MKKEKEIKRVTWQMRTNKVERTNIATLAARLGCKESEAVRHAIRHTLATMPLKTASK